MTLSAKLTGIVLLSGLALLPGANVSSADEATGYRVEPLKGITLAVGQKRAVGYYKNAAWFLPSDAHVGGSLFRIRQVGVGAGASQFDGSGRHIGAGRRSERIGCVRMCHRRVNDDHTTRSAVRV